MQVLPATKESLVQVYLIRLDKSGKATQTIGVMTLAHAEAAIERGTSRLVAIDIDNGQVMAASHEQDMYRSF